MAAGSENAPGRTETVHHSSRTRVTRLYISGRTVVRKEPLGPDAEHRLRHETAMLERLRGIAGIAQLAPGPRYPESIVLADAGVADLAGLAKPLAAADLIDLAARLARAVADMHRREVIHRDISPSNIVLSADGVPCLVDFALATSFAQIRLEFTHHSEIAGTIAYMAPEQTGRTGRGVDHRADLYGLGATLYELATGQPPFGSGDPLRLIHDHLTRVPAPPADIVPAVPGPLSAIIMHLLEKEPDNRYQSADGVVYDLERVRNAPASGQRVGEHDVPVRLLPPSRLVGRDAEITELREAFTEALAGRCAGVLVAGVPGVGKTALANELRAVATASGGWFVTGKFDQYRRDLEFDAGYQAFRALGRLLLAEPEAELADARDRIMAAAGPNAGLLTAVLPEFAALLAVPPDPGDPQTAQVRAQVAAARVMRAIASRDRPLVMFMDDLQWTGTAPLGFLDTLLSEEPVPGLLLVGAYRDEAVDGAHPLAAPLARWREQATVRHWRLANLSGPSLDMVVAEMLRADPAEAASLAEALRPYTGGNPYETVELLNALRHDGLLTVTPAGWRWQTAAVRARLTGSQMTELLGNRLAAMPEPTRRVVEAMACLGGRAELTVLEAATGATTPVADALEPAIEDGLLVAEPGARDAVRFGHDRIRDAVLDGIEPGRRHALGLAMARRLAAAPELFAVAAEQYLPFADAVTDAAERRVLANLLRRAADQAALIGESRLVEKFLTGALAVTDPGETAALLELRTRRHAALVSLGRLDEADQDYAVIDAQTATALDRPEATVLQMRSLVNRGRTPEALDLGIQSLRECGVTVPAVEQLPAELDRLLGRMYRWLDNTQPADDLARAEATDPALIAAGRLLNAMLPATFFIGAQAYAWVGLEALRIWTEHGPVSTLVGSAANAAFEAVVRRGDYAAAYQVARRVLALGEARGYEPDSSHARNVMSLLTCWFEPVETTVEVSTQAREGLLAGGDLANASYSYHATVVGLLDSSPTLDGCLRTVEEALAFERRIGSEQPGQWLNSYLWLADVLRGEEDTAYREFPAADSYESNPLTLIHVHTTRAVAAVILGDPDALARHSAAALPLQPVAVGWSVSAMAYPLRGLALAWQARTADGDERARLLAELNEVTRWLAARAADAPANFLHLLRFVEAERAWTEGDFRTAVRAFDAARLALARLAVTGRRRPWHAALITERSARFCLAYGIEQAGYELLAAARRHYLDWGATAKVRQLDWAYPTLRPAAGARPGAGEAGQAAGPIGGGPAVVTSGTIDLLGILSASQALSSETSVESLHERVADVLGTMTGATGVHLALWEEDQRGWRLAAQDDDGAFSGHEGVSGNERVSGHDRQRPGAPESVLRYVQRTREPLIVDDVARDGRFARDAYFADVATCSLLAVPILSRGDLRAVLLLENRLMRDAFAGGRLDAVALIAGQLTVSLDNTQLYAQYRRVADEQAALRRVATLVARAAPPEEVFTAVAAEVGSLLGVDHAFLVRYDPPDAVEVVGTWLRTGADPPTPVGSRMPLDGHNVSALVYRTGRPARVDYEHASGVVANALRGWGARSAVGVPVTIESRLWGAMLVAFTRERVPPPDIEARLAGFTELVGTAIGNAEAIAEVTASRARIVGAADQARRRIERDLHDGAQQRLVSLTLQLRQAQAAVPSGLGELNTQLDRAVATANGALDELGEIARGIHPAALTSGGLRPAVQALARRSLIPVRTDVRTDRRLPEPVEVSAYYVVAEALTNAAKHARASAVSVRIELDGEALLVVVSDDGVGGAGLARGTGLVGLNDRVEALGGRMVIDSPEGAGTRLRVELPLAAGSDVSGR
jgi:predicted ATPase/signal transduction histidine kinase